ncbi:jg24962, partial [Pararge aegeria aegeria]
VGSGAGVVEHRFRLAPAGPLVGTRVLCYADDTFSEASRLATVGTPQVVRRIQALRLRVSVPKTKNLLFHGPAPKLPHGCYNKPAPLIGFYTALYWNANMARLFQ